MKPRYLEVTFRKGCPIAAYLYLDRRPDDRSVRVERRDDGLLIDFAQDGRAIGIEITAPRLFNIQRLNEILAEFKQQAIDPDDVAPLIAA